MKRLLSRFCVLILAGILGGCIEFEEQNMSYRYDKASDELRIFQDYHGIFGADAKSKADVPLSGEELGQLQSVLEGQRTFFFENWIFEYNREELERSRTDLRDPEKSEIAVADRPKFKKLFDLLIDKVNVRNGPFYLGADGKLCGVQSVTISHCSEIVAAVNACTPIFLNEMAEQDDVSDADLKAIAKFKMDADPKMLRLDGNAVSLRWPISRASYDKSFGPESDDAARVKEFRAAGIGIAWASDVMTFSIGKKDDQITSVTLGFSEANYTPNAVEPARTEHVIKKDFDPAAAAKSFLLGKGAEK